MSASAQPIPFAARARPADGVLFRELEDEAVLLSLADESYYGLDDVGTRMWLALEASATIQGAFDALCGEYDVAAPQLRRDLEEFLHKLMALGLIEIQEP